MPILRAYLNRLGSQRSSAEHFLNISFGKSCTKNNNWCYFGEKKRKEKKEKRRKTCQKELNIYVTLNSNKKTPPKKSYFRSVTFSVSEMNFIYSSSHTF